MAGDYVATRELAEQAGVLVADSLDLFEDAIRITAAYDLRGLRGRRLGAISNAGFECVAFADHLGALTLAPFSEATRTGLLELFDRTRLSTLVEVRNPLDLTPMADDQTFSDAVRLVVGDESVDLAVVGCIPHTPALETLPASAAHHEDITHPTSLAARLAALRQECPKPWVAVVDAGSEYQPMQQALARAGIVTFPSADRALRALNLICRTPRAGTE